MTKVNKIVKNKIESFVDPLLDNGYSVYTISDMIKDNYSDNPDLKNGSHMMVQRYKEHRDKSKLIEVDQSGEDMVEFVKQEYRDTVSSIRKEINKWKKRNDELYKKAETDGSISDVAKVIKQANDTLMNELKVSESKLDRLGRQIKSIGDINQKKVQNLNIIMIGLANKLCPECKKRILEELSKLT